MLVVGLTGSIGMGKSTAAARFRARGFAVFDADAEVHRLYEGPLAADIEAAFPGTTVEGRVDRQKLSQALLKQPEKFRVLESIVHPRVRSEQRAFLQREFARGSPLAVLEVPLLFEGGLEKSVDLTIVVSADADVQKKRVLARSGMTDVKFAEIIARQMPDEEKRARADFVVDTSGAVVACDAAIDAILDKILSRPGNAYQRHWA